LALTAVCLVYRPWAADYFYGGFRYQRTDMRIDAFVLPCALAVLLRQPVWKERATRYLNTWALILMFGLIAVGSIAAGRITSLNTVNKFLQAALLPLIVVSPILRPASWLAQMLNWSWLQWIGRISYGIYLWQQMFLFSTSNSPQHLFLLIPAIAGIIFVSWLSYRYVERPLRNYGRRLADRIEAEPLPQKLGPRRAEEIKAPRRSVGMQ
jgi:peptidoglycan/LPS O-acetylase OafA/YrhL